MVVKDELHSLCILKKIYMLRRMTRRSWKLASRRDYSLLLSFSLSKKLFTISRHSLIILRRSFTCSLMLFLFLIFDFYISQEYP